MMQLSGQPGSLEAPLEGYLGGKGGGGENWRTSVTFANTASNARACNCVGCLLCSPVSQVITIIR